jgi:hypothetical protein
VLCAQGMRVPVGDTLYRTLKSYEEIAQTQAVKLQDMIEEFENLKLQNEYASTLSLGLAVSPSRASPAGKKSPFAREQRRYCLSTAHARAHARARARTRPCSRSFSSP